MTFLKTKDLKISTCLLKRKGWKMQLLPDMPDKCVICLAPHTSNWDFFWGLLFAKSTGLDAHFLMKKEWFFFPVGCIMKMLGGIPVDRARKQSLTDAMTEMFAKNRKFCLAVAPEGTRQLVNEWKKGFYFIATKAQVPILLAYIDYNKHEIGFGKMVTVSGDIDVDLPLIQAFYHDKRGKFEERFHI